MRKVPRGHTFPFEGTKVSVASSILKKWAEIPTDEKLRFIDASYEEIVKRHRTESENLAEKAWLRECALLRSVKKVREINLADNVWELGNIDCFTFTRDPNKLRAAAATLETAAKELRKTADSIESRPSLLPKGNELLRAILVKHWAPPNGVRLCWMSYPALEKFLGLTCLNNAIQSAEALRKECQRLGLPKLDHPLVKEEQVRESGKCVCFLSSR